MIDAGAEWQDLAVDIDEGTMSGRNPCPLDAVSDRIIGKVHHGGAAA